MTAKSQRQRNSTIKTALLALAAVSVSAVNAGKLRARQYPADAPSCARICIAAKIAEVVDPGLATSCDGTSGAAYVTCICGTSKFTRAYDTCLTQNCVFPNELEAGRQLFTAFCNSPSEQEISSANAVASQAIASQSSVYAAESRTATTGAASSGASTAASSSSAASSGASSSSIANTGTATSGSAATTSGAASSTSTGASSPTSGATSTSTGTTNASQTTSAPSTSSESPRSSGTLGAQAVASALANATGVSSANSLYTPALLSTFGCAAIAVVFHALL